MNDGHVPTEVLDALDGKIEPVILDDGAAAHAVHRFQVLPDVEDDDFKFTQTGWFRNESFWTRYSGDPAVPRELRMTIQAVSDSLPVNPQLLSTKYQSSPGMINPHLARTLRAWIHPMSRG